MTKSTTETRRKVTVIETLCKHCDGFYKHTMFAVSPLQPKSVSEFHHVVRCSNCKRERVVARALEGRVTLHDVVAEYKKASRG
jgi:hypothetical protein